MKKMKGFKYEDLKVCHSVEECLFWISDKGQLQAFICVFMYISKAMCAFWSTTQCDLQLYIWFPWQQKKIRESGVFFSCVSSTRGHGVSVCFCASQNQSGFNSD